MFSVRCFKFEFIFSLFMFLTISVMAESPRLRTQLDTVETPNVDPPADSYEDSIEVTITTATDGATIYYRTDGISPATDDTEYDGPILVDQSMNIRAIACKVGYRQSTIRVSNTCNN